MFRPDLSPESATACALTDIFRRSVVCPL